MKQIKIMIVSLMAILVTACGGIESGNVGVQTVRFTGEIREDVLGQGFYTAFFTKVDEYSTREIAVDMPNLQPKANDNLTLERLDVQVYYRVKPSEVARLNIAYANRNLYEDDVGYPAYYLIQAISRDAVEEVVSRYDSLDMHRNREILRDDIMEEVKKRADRHDEGTFEITRVVIRDVRTDSSVEESIQLAVRRNKELEAMKIETDIAREEAERNRVLAQSLSPAILENRRIRMMEEVCKEGRCIFNIGDSGTSTTPVIDVTQ